MDWATVGAYALAGVVLLVVLWPTVSGGRRFLKRWGLREPDEEQAKLAMRYLRDRRLLYPPLFLLAPLVLPSDWGPGVYVPLVAALLVAEAIGAIKPVRGPRVARLTRRKWSDLVQRWAVGTMIVLGVLAIGLAVAGLVAQPWADRVIGSNTLSEQARTELGDPVGVLVILMVALGLVEVLGIIGFAVHRVPVQDPQVDAVLRTRSARVGVGIGLAWMTSAVALANDRLTFLDEIQAPEPAPSWLESLSFGGIFGFVMLLIGAAGWYWVANPASKMPYVQSAK
jgi:hypothetical protein